MMTKMIKPEPAEEKAMADAISYLLADALAHGMAVTAQALDLALVGISMEGHKLGGGSSKN